MDINVNAIFQAVIAEIAGQVTKQLDSVITDKVNAACSGVATTVAAIDEKFVDSLLENGGEKLMEYVHEHIDVTDAVAEAIDTDEIAEEVRNNLDISDEVRNVLNNGSFEITFNS